MQCHFLLKKNNSQNMGINLCPVNSLNTGFSERGASQGYVMLCYDPWGIRTLEDLENYGLFKC
jgi:hypothetical protein